MNDWALYTAAFAAVVIQAWAGRKESPNWYLRCIVPLLYGAAVAWLFVGRDCIRVFQVVILGAALPISLLVSVWLKKREERPDEGGERPRTDM